ncbi:PEP-CTERM sorting domain-containing protein [Duganella vulcania]|uniref:PEP-CTERM sorting domain-containing protein n=1 Tax=Duganella vulcania TaxID=2692166 RepID=A0A845GTF5_9BURK|nr:PEP-CTERM sorting domain-containing protein [Duganella vulcania]MYM96508.1 hypothetical protein [Duganella vulcania]
MCKIAALVLCASALNVQAYAAEPAPVAAHATSGATSASGIAKPAKPAAKKADMVSVPEPVSYKLILLGVAVLLLFARSGKRREQPWTK